MNTYTAIADLRVMAINCGRAVKIASDGETITLAWAAGPVETWPDNERSRSEIAARLAPAAGDSRIKYQSRSLNPYCMLAPQEAASRRWASDEFRRLAAAGEIEPGYYSSSTGLGPNSRPCKRPYRDEQYNDYHDVVVVE